MNYFLKKEIVALIALTSTVLGQPQKNEVDERHANPDQPAALAGADSLIPRLRSYSTDIPPIEFIYRIKTALSDRRIQFRTSNGMFYFRELESDQGNSGEVLAFDGRRYYSLFDKNYLVVTRDPENLKGFIDSWFSYNPVYNPIRQLTVNSDRFGGGFLRYSEIWEGLAKNIENVVANKDCITAGLRYSGEDYVKISFEKSIFLKSLNGRYKRHNVDWKVKNYHSVKYKGMEVLIPTDISCEYFTLNGEPSNYSYSIAIETASIKPLDSNVNPNEFRIPISEVDEVYDADLKARVKTPDWIQ